MTEIICVKFRNNSKVYFFDPAGLEISEGENVVVETSKGLELALCAQGNHEVDDDCVVQPLRPVVRAATETDLRMAEINCGREKEAFEICRNRIAARGLDMKLVDVECSFEGNKTTFYFTADGRVDFRELVKDLAGIFRNRIELRQIGVRDEAKKLGGLGICGRPFCCSQFLGEFQPVSTKMAKNQSISLNPTKISGTCGRLMCCLRYEEEAYEDLLKTVPKAGAYVETPAGYGSVAQVNLLRQDLKIKLDGEDGETFKTYKACEVAVVPGGRPKEGEKPPELLKYRPAPAPAEPEEEEDFWTAPSMIVEEAPPAGTPARAEPRPARRQNARSRRGPRKGGKSKKPGSEPQPQPAAGRKPERAAKPKQKPGLPRSRRRKPDKPHPPKSEGHGKPPKT